MVALITGVAALKVIRLRLHKAKAVTTNRRMVVITIAKITKVKAVITTNRKTVVITIARIIKATAVITIARIAKHKAVITTNRKTAVITIARITKAKAVITTVRMHHAIWPKGPQLTAAGSVADTSENGCGS